MPVAIKGSGGGSVTLSAAAAAADTTLTLPNTTGTILQSGTAVTVAQGGTGLTSPGTAGNVLTSTGSAWASTAPTSGTGPAFSAYQTGTAQVLPVSTYTKIVLNAEEFDTNSNFDSATNYRFTPTVAGYYQINAVIFPLSPTTIVSALYKNGSVYKYGTGTTTYGNVVSLAALVYLNGSTDYVELYAYSTVTATMTTGTTGVSMQGFLARSA